MKNYELIAELVKQPAGMEVQFWGGIKEENIDEPEEGYCTAKSKINEIDVVDGIINLC